MTVDLEDRLRRTLVVKAAQVTDAHEARVETRPVPPHRRRWPLTLAAAVVVLLAVMGGVLLVDRAGSPDLDPATDGEARPEVVPASWGGPVDLFVGDERLFVHFDAHTGPGRGGIARLDTDSGELTPVVEVEKGSAVAYGQGSLWVFSPASGRLERLDPETGDEQAGVLLHGVADEGGYRLAVGDRSVWVVPFRSSPVTVVDVETLAETRGGSLDRPSTRPVVVGDVAYVGTEDGLQAVDADGAIHATDVPGHVTDLAAGREGLWVTTGDGAFVASELGYLSFGADEPVLQDVLPMEGGVLAMGAVDGRVCLVGDTALANPALRCGPEPSTDQPVTIDASTRIPSSFANGGLAALAGSLWGGRWESGIIRRIDPETARSSTVVDLGLDD